MATLTEVFQGIANAIRTKTGGTGTITPEDMDNEILSISAMYPEPTLPEDLDTITENVVLMFNYDDGINGVWLRLSENDVFSTDIAHADSGQLPYMAIGVILVTGGTINIHYTLNQTSATNQFYIGDINQDLLDDPDTLVSIDSGTGVKSFENLDPGVYLIEVVAVVGEDAPGSSVVVSVTLDEAINTDTDPGIAPTDAAAGYYIVGTNNRCYTAETWSNRASDVSLLGIGVIYHYPGSHGGFIIAPTNTGLYAWDSAYGDNGLIVGCSTDPNAVDGVANTDAMMNAEYQGVEAAQACRSYTWAIDKQGYLGSATEWAYVVWDDDSFSTINSLLTLCGGDLLLGEGYWTSTQYSDSKAWVVVPEFDPSSPDLSILQPDKDEVGVVRPFAEF